MPAFDYDLVIIGAGPAGLTAGLYAARARLDVLLIEKAVPGGQIIVTDWIENYPGFPEGISGFDLAEKMKVQAEALGLKMETAEVQSLNVTPDVKEVVLQEKTIRTRSL
jgi:thioredoxin reductase (NADPH)